MSEHESSFSSKPFPSLPTPSPSEVCLDHLSSNHHHHLNFDEHCPSLTQLVTTEHSYSRPFDLELFEAEALNRIQTKKTKKRKDKKKSKEDKKHRKQKRAKCVIDQESNSADASSQHSTPSGSDQYRQEESIGMEEEGTPSGANDSLTLSASGRVQRIRKKPKRWEDDDLEVDFTGRLQFLKNSNSRKSTGSAVKESPTVNKRESVTNNNKRESVTNNNKRESLTTNNKSEPLPTTNNNTHELPSTVNNTRESLTTTANNKRESLITNNNNKKTVVTPKVIVINNNRKRGQGVKKEEEEKPIVSSSSEEDEVSDSADSEFGSDDDPEKLWCVCRQPYNRRFMIGCDSCEEWYHGKCVDVTKVQGRKMEKLKQEWFCPWCKPELEKGVTREVLKQRAQQRMAEIEAKEKEKQAGKKKKQNESRKSDGAGTKRSASASKKRRSLVKDESSSEDEKPTPKTPRKEKEVPKPPREVKRNSKLEKELEDERRLKMLIKASKRDLEKKVALVQKSNSTEVTPAASTKTDQSPVTPTTNTVASPEITVNKTKPDSAQKKKKAEEIDESVHDLFKVEPVLVRSQSTSSAGIPTTPSMPRKMSAPGGSAEGPRRQSITASSSGQSSLSDTGKTVNCVNCGKSVILQVESPSIYCNATCLQNYVTESVKFLRQVKKQREKANPDLALKPLKVAVFDKIKNKMLTGTEALAEKDVLEFISKNPTYEIQKPPKLEEPKTPLSSAASSSVKVTTPTTPTKPMAQYVTLKAEVNKKERTLSMSSSTSVTSPVKLERSSSTSNDDTSRRNFVKNAVTDIFNTRQSEMNEKEKAKISKVNFSKLAKRIEEELFKIFRATNHKYNVKSRSLIFNLKDPKNSLFSRVLLGEITPERLASMTPEELASSELARWRENEKKTMIELIKRDAVDQANQVIVKKTHKGEEFIAESDIVTDLPDIALAAQANDKDSKPSKEKVEDEVKTNEKSLAKPATVVSEKPAVSVVQPSASAVVAVKSEPKISSPKTPTPQATVSPVFDILDDTPNHGSHVYSSNCKICSKEEKEPEKPKEKEVKRAFGNTFVTVEGKPDQQKPQHQPKRVRVEHESTNKFLEEAYKLSDKLLAESANALSDSPKNNVDSVQSSQPSTEPVSKPQEAKNREEEKKKSKSKSIWKGTIYMQDVANFVASAYVVTGSSLAASLPNESINKITVCGRIAPEQVLDYIGKLKRSKRTEIGIVQFVWASREERTGYDAFFNYLNMRGRYGVVDNTGRAFKDFYIMPLSKTSEIPPVLLPGEGHVPLSTQARPNLLLGVMILTNRKSSSAPVSSVPHSLPQSSNSNDATMERSYTPPLTNNTGSTTPPLDTRPDEGSYTPPHPSTSSVVPLAASSTVASKRTLSYEDAALESSSKVGKYDPTVRITMAEASIIHSHKTKLDQSSATNKIAEAKQTAHPSPKTQSSEKRIFDKVAVESLVNKKDNESTTATSLPSASNTNSVAPIQPELINNFNLHNIEIPDNLASILKSIQTKPVENNGSKTESVSATRDNISSTDNMSSLVKSDSQKSPANCNSDIAKSSSDPRIRIKQAALQDQDMRKPTVSAVANSEPPKLSQDELLRKMAQEQMAALAQFETTPKSLEPVASVAPTVDPSVINVDSASAAPFLSPPPAEPPVRVSPGFSFTGMVPSETTSPPQPSSNLPKISFSWKRKK